MPQLNISVCNLSNANTGSGASANSTILTPPGNQTVWLAGLYVMGSGATASATPALTITGLLAGTWNGAFFVPGGVTLTAGPLVLPFNPPLQGSPGTPITVQVGAFGAGATLSAIGAWGWASLS